MKKILLWAGLVFLLLVLVVGLIRSQQGQVGIGEVAPDFELISFSGETYQISDFRGNVIVVNFWASWCEACKPEAEDLEAAYKFYEPRGDVLFLGVDYVDTETEALAYLEKFNITYANGPDLGTYISQSYRMRGVPETYIVGPDGRIVAVQIGPYMSLDQIVAQIELARSQ